MNGALVEQMRS